MKIRAASTSVFANAIDLVLRRPPVLSRASDPMPMLIGTLDAVHLAAALIWRDRVGPLPEMATHDAALGVAVVTLNTVPSGTSHPPFGSFDTPANGSTGIVGSVAVTGWALDDVGVTRVTICRSAVTGETFSPDGLFDSGATIDNVATRGYIE
jgi:hypothetical protein